MSSFQIKRPGALTAAVGGKPSKHMAAVRALSAGGGLKAKEARFYLNVLKPASSRRTAAVNKLKKG